MKCNDASVNHNKILSENQTKQRIVDKKSVNIHATKITELLIIIWNNLIVLPDIWFLWHQHRPLQSCPRTASRTRCRTAQRQPPARPQVDMLTRQHKTLCCEDPRCRCCCRCCSWLFFSRSSADSWDFVSSDRNSWRCGGHDWKIFDITKMKANNAPNQQKCYGNNGEIFIAPCLVKI